MRACNGIALPFLLYALVNEQLKVFETASAFYVGFVRYRVKRRFLVSNVAVDEITMLRAAVCARATS